MTEFKDLKAWIAERSELKASGKTIGFVPTMGALHPGHASLLKRARLENDIVVLSIYVNPTQFNNPDDLKKYPITLDRDREIAAKAGVDVLLLPLYEQIYPDGYKYKVNENDFSTQLCGAHRPGHFDGVLTVVMKLLNLVQPERAYFGEKDYQQLQLIRGMTEAFFMPTEIVACPTLREEDGLAMSSRNLNLSAEARAKAPELRKILLRAASADEARLQLVDEGFTVDYVEDRATGSATNMGQRRFAAALLGGVRLIDNVER